MMHFVQNCSRCHGTYGPAGVYPNLVVSLEEAGTDQLLARADRDYNDRFILQYNDSFYGELGGLAPAPGYIAPPLDGIWATAPFLHNGSVPTLQALLHSSERPTWWTWSYDTHDFDPAAVGYTWTALDHGRDAEPLASEQIKIYDTTQPGYGNKGHTFGDVLNDADRAAVIEYLKTL